MNKDVRQPVVAGQFYPTDPVELQREINSYLEQVSVANNEKVVALISPHAGYVYSGSVAAHGYKSLVGRSIKRVVLLGNSHRHYFPGLAIDDHDYWQTPLGKVKVDNEWAEKLVEMDSSINFNRLPHEEEHSLEVQLPFLQTVLQDDFVIVPILFGNTKGEESRLLSQFLKDNLIPGDLVIVSTDLSHYLSADKAEAIDSATLASIMTNNIPEGENKFCGGEAVDTIIYLAQDLNWASNLLNYSHSGQVTGDNQRVVGYASVLFSQNIKAELDADQQQELLKIARQTVEQYILTGEILKPEIKDKRFQEVDGVFVTLHKGGQLRGCIGNVIGQGPLGLTVRDMAISAATEDGRFLPVSKDELDSLDYEISVLSSLQKAANWKNIELGYHGVVVRRGLHSGVFLPQVAVETGWGLEEFLGHLCVDKAELEPDCYKNNTGVELYTFTAQVFD